MTEKAHPMKLKTVTIDGKTYAEVDGDRPVYVHDDGKEIPFDAKAATDTITARNGEAMRHRENLDEAKRALKAFEGIDPTAARDALDKLSKIDAKALVAAGDMDAAVAAALKPVQEQLLAANKTIEGLNGDLNREVIGGNFGRSKFVTDKLTPAGADLIRTLYADRVKVEGGKPVGYDENGQKLYSRARPGELADFDEVVEAFVEKYPHKDHILRGDIKSGGGSQQPGSGGGSKLMKQSDFDKLDPKTRATRMSEGLQLVAD